MAGERLTRQEAAEQRRQLRQLLMEAYACDRPAVGLLVKSDDDEYLFDLLYKAKYEDPVLKNMKIGLKSEGIAIFHDSTRDRDEVVAEGASDESKDPDASNGEAHSDL